MSNLWNSQKRVEAALNHQEADRIPMDMTITEIPYIQLRELLGMPPDENLHPNRFGEVEPAHDLLEALGFDIMAVKLRSPVSWSPLGPHEDGTEFDQWGVGRKSINTPGGEYDGRGRPSPLEE